MPATAAPIARRALRGDLLDFTADPGLGTPNAAAARFRPDHWLLIEGERIVAVLPPAQAPGDDWPREDHRGRLLLPGFIDTHVHSAQLDVIASFGTELLDWLERYTFPAEARHADPAHAARAAEGFVDALLACGTTAAVVFPTVHTTSVQALFGAARARGMRLVAGKVLMDRHAPAALRDDVTQAEADCEALIARWHGQGRLAYAVTPRFAATSTPAQLAMAGALLARHDGLYLQTHLAENRAEVAWIARLFPDARSYLDVYDRHGLLGERSVFAHGVWLDAADRARLAEAGAQIAHSPSSNLFLGSGLMDWRALHEAGAAVTVASDVGGGTALCMVRTLADAYKVQALRGEKLSAFKAVHAATLGAAQALQLAGEIGSFDAGRMADLCVWNWACGPVATHRDALARDLHERLFAWMMLADERALVTTVVAGRTRYERPTHESGAAMETRHERLEPGAAP
ncbi:MAG: guanine deaminase [Ideonella sp.]|nr:guanine deaminase [Ideonella sp.]MCC7455714.1 guanine deaminase [Nitrospira sp.]